MTKPRDPFDIENDWIDQRILKQPHDDDDLTWLFDQWARAVAMRDDDDYEPRKRKE
jgi:hypothetical protein